MYLVTDESHSTIVWPWKMGDWCVAIVDQLNAPSSFKFNPNKDDSSTITRSQFLIWLVPLHQRDLKQRKTVPNGYFYTFKSMFYISMKKRSTEQGLLQMEFAFTNTLTKDAFKNENSNVTRCLPSCVIPINELTREKLHYILFKYVPSYIIPWMLWRKSNSFSLHFFGIGDVMILWQ